MDFSPGLAHVKVTTAEAGLRNVPVNIKKDEATEKSKILSKKTLKAIVVFCRRL